MLNENNLKHNIKNLKILAYHTINDRANFVEQLKYIETYYSVISLEDLILFFVNEQKLPKNPLLITFDDGDLSVYSNAFPLLDKYKLPAVLFVITDLIGSQKPFWWDEIEYYLGKKEGNEKVWEIKAWPNRKREDYLIKLRADSQKPLMEYKQLSTQQLRKMQAGNICIANHSHTHPMFDQCTKEELKKEMKNATTILRNLGFTPNVFAYPNGNSSSGSERMLKEFDIKLAFLFDHQINRGKIDPLRISRLSVDDTTPIWKFKFILSGWHSRLLPVTRSLGKISQKIKK